MSPTTDDRVGVQTAGGCSLELRDRYQVQFYTAAPSPASLSRPTQAGGLQACRWCVYVFVRAGIVTLPLASLRVVAWRAMPPRGKNRDNK